MTTATKVLTVREAIKGYMLLETSAEELDRMCENRFSITDAATRLCQSWNSPMVFELRKRDGVERIPNLFYVRVVIRDVLYERRNQLAAAKKAIEG